MAVPDSVMLRASVVPQCQRVRLPPDTAMKAQRCGDVRKQHVEQCPALPSSQFPDVRRETAVHVEHLAAGDRVNGHDGMFVSRIATLGRSRSVAADVGHATVVNGREPFEKRLQCR